MPAQAAFIAFIVKSPLLAVMGKQRRRARRVASASRKETPMAPFRAPAPAARTHWVNWLLLAAAIIAALHLGRDVLAPLALAILLTIAALPLVEWLERRRVPRIAAVVVVLALVLAIIVTLVGVVLNQALELAQELPRYEQVLQQKLATLSQGTGPIDGLMRLVKRLGANFAPAEAAPSATVVVAASGEGRLAGLFGIALLVLAPVATLAITLLLMAFILIGRENLRDRLLRIAGLHEMHRTTAAMTDATSRLGRFLLMQLVVNGVFGAGMGIGLWLLGLPNAPLWGVLSFALRFIPFLGAPLSVLFPLLIAFATTDGWGTVIGVVAVFAVVDIAVTYVLEPWLYGASTGVTPIALLLSSAFWAMIWGPVGLILAPAITACLVIAGRHVQALGFLDVLLGDTAPLPADARFYQRLLARDTDGAARLLTRESDRTSVDAALGTLVLPAIARISGDRGEAGFGPAMATGSARTLLRVLEGGLETPEGRPDAVVLAVGRALDRAAAVAVALSLHEAGIAAATAPDPTGKAPLAVLAIADGSPRHRVVAALRDAHHHADAVLVYAATDEAAAALAAAGLRIAWAETLAQLVAEARGVLDNEARVAA
jgi:predicted PurR-regulated permease PerM